MYNDYNEQTLIDTYGAEYYKSLIMFTLNADGTGAVMLGSESMDITYTFDGSTLTLTTSQGDIVMPLVDGHFYCTDVDGNIYGFSKM